MKTTFPFLNAYTFGFCEKRGFTKGSGWKWSLAEMKRTTGCNAVILPICAWQEHTYSTIVDSEHPDVMDADDVRAVCDEARRLNLKIILKAMVNCRDGYWRAYIRFFDHDVPTEPGWPEWFASWENHVSIVARMAEENKADLFCIGCETVGTDGRETEWRHVIGTVRQLYHGPITYNCDKYQEGNVSWWDAVDVISSSGYYPINELSKNFARIHDVSERFGKPFMFMECGCPSRGKSDLRPNDWRFGEGLDLETQERWYRAFVDEIKKNLWICGTGWWDWSATRLYPERMGQDNNNYCTYGKPANDVLLQFSHDLTLAELEAYDEHNHSITI